jgi:hypothetical protein
MRISAQLLIMRIDACKNELALLKWSPELRALKHLPNVERVVVKTPDLQALSEPSLGLASFLAKGVTRRDIEFVNFEEAAL